MQSTGLEIVVVAQDTGGEAAAGKWYDAAKATFTQLIDAQHYVSTAFQFINVPTGVWIDERGRVVRPGEPAWNTDQTMKFGGKSLETEGTAYLNGIRDWVRNGDKSSWVLSDAEFAKRVQPPSASAAEADATFKLAVWFHDRQQNELALKHWKRAQELNPDDWNYHRQEWSFTGDEGKKWLEKFAHFEKDYYPKLNLPDKK